MENLKKVNGYYVDKKRIGQRIFDIRKNRNDTLEEFGKMFNASKGNVLNWENGLSVPNRARIEKLAKKGGITVNELLYGSIEEFIENNFEGIFNHHGIEYPTQDFIENKKEILELKKELNNNIRIINDIGIDLFTINDIDKLWEYLVSYCKNKSISKQFYNRSNLLVEILQIFNEVELNNIFYYIIEYLETKNKNDKEFLLELENYKNRWLKL